MTSEQVPEKPAGQPAGSVDNALEDATRAARTEHEMGLLQSLRVYRKGVLWSLAISTSIIMEGFDLVLINGLYALPAFQRKFGVLQPDGSYELTAAWQAGLSNGSQIGQITGVFISGLVADRYGYRRTLMAGLAGIAAFIFIQFFSPSIEVLLVGQMLLGIPFGIFQTLACTYASEVCPVQLRAYLTTYINLCWVLGQIVGSSVLRAMLDVRPEQWSYRIPFAVQWVWPVPIFVAVVLAPESPWWLVRHGRLAEARRAIGRLTSSEVRDSGFDVDGAVAMIAYTNQLEKTVSSGTSFVDCFKGTDLRRTEIVCGVWAAQILCGSSFMGYSTYFYRQVGLDEPTSFTMSIAQYCLGALGVFASWFMMRWAGRRTLYLYGQAAMALLLAVMGFASFATNLASKWAIGCMLLVYTFVYDSTVGPVCYSLVSELPSTRLKAKSVVLARNVYNMLGIANNFLTPPMLNPSAWNWGPKAGFFWAVSCALCCTWTFFRLPEPKGRTYAKLDALFEAKVPARKFKDAAVDQFMKPCISTTDTSVLGAVSTKSSNLQEPTPEKV